ncbi:MAG: hypothetical protein NTW45_09785 [Rhodocyclales bacterium]|nr:hypothetical protein [Rhodocyclales bacterium]
MMRRFINHPALALGSTLLWGAIELLALLRSRWNQPGRPHGGWNDGFTGVMRSNQKKAKTP